MTEEKCWFINVRWVIMKVRRTLTAVCSILISWTGPQQRNSRLTSLSEKPAGNGPANTTHMLRRIAHDCRRNTMRGGQKGVSEAEERGKRHHPLVLDLPVWETSLQMVRKRWKLDHREKGTLGLTPEWGQHLQDKRIKSLKSPSTIQYSN